MQNYRVGTISSLSVHAMQGLNAEIYLVQNDRNYSTSEIISRIHNYVGLVDKAVEREKFEFMGYYLAMALSWQMAFWNRFHYSAEEEVWNRFPGRCPYCGSAVCDCGTERPLNRIALTETVAVGCRPATLKRFQEMLRGIYPKNTLSNSSRRLQQEVSELDQAYNFFKGTHRKDLLLHVVEEAVDVFTRTCAVATCAKLDLADLMEVHFKDGCPKCHRIPCDEGYTTAQSVPVR